MVKASRDVAGLVSMTVTSPEAGGGADNNLAACCDGPRSDTILRCSEDPFSVSLCSITAATQKKQRIHPTSATPIPIVTLPAIVSSSIMLPPIVELREWDGVLVIDGANDADADGKRRPLVDGVANKDVERVDELLDV